MQNCFGVFISGRFRGLPLKETGATVVIIYKGSGYIYTIFKNSVNGFIFLVNDWFLKVSCWPDGFQDAYTPTPSHHFELNS
jgi:hypothetical protein